MTEIFSAFRKRINKYSEKASAIADAFLYVERKGALAKIYASMFDFSFICLRLHNNNKICEWEGGSLSIK